MEDLVLAVDLLTAMVQVDPEGARPQVDSFLETVIAGLMKVYPNTSHFQMKDILIFTANCPYPSNSNASKIYNAVKLFLKVYMDIDELTHEEFEEMAVSNLNIMKAAVQKDPSIAAELSDDMHKALGL